MLDFIKKELEEKEKMKKRADILFPSMKIKGSEDDEKEKKFIGLGEPVYKNEKKEIEPKEEKL